MSRRSSSSAKKTAKRPPAKRSLAKRPPAKRPPAKRPPAKRLPVVVRRTEKHTPRRLSKLRRQVPGTRPVAAVSRPDPVAYVRKKPAELNREARRLDRERRQRERQLAPVLRRLRPRQRDAGHLVFVLAADQVKRRGRRKVVTARAGDRVTAGDRRKVFVFRQTRPSKKHPKGRLVPYYDWSEQKLKRKLPPKAVKLRSVDPDTFKSVTATKEFFADVRSLMEDVELTPSPGRSLDFMEDIVPAVAESLRRAADEAGSNRMFRVECSVGVRSRTRRKTLTFAATFRQADMQQFMDAGFYEPFVSRKLYAEFAQQSAELGFVSRGSSDYIGELEINEDRDREDWRDAKGFKWKHGLGHTLDPVSITRFHADPQLVVIHT